MCYKVFFQNEPKKLLLVNFIEPIEFEKLKKKITKRNTVNIADFQEQTNSIK